MEPVTLVVDTREQEPYTFDSARVRTIRKALPAGDYSIAGWEGRVAVERKSLDDFVGTVIRNRERFHRELDRLRTYEAAAVVVEGNLSDVTDHAYRSNAHPASVFGAVLSIIVDSSIPVFFCSSRQLACRFVEGFLLRFHRKAGPPCPLLPPAAESPSRDESTPSISPARPSQPADSR